MNWLHFRDDETSSRPAFDALDRPIAHPNADGLENFPLHPLDGSHF